jgi:hypothetical protein
VSTNPKYLSFAKVVSADILVSRVIGLLEEKTGIVLDGEA